MGCGLDAQARRLNRRVRQRTRRKRRRCRAFVRRRRWRSCVPCAIPHLGHEFLNHPMRRRRRLIEAGPLLVRRRRLSRRGRMSGMSGRRIRRRPMTQRPRRNAYGMRNLRILLRRRRGRTRCGRSGIGHHRTPARLSRRSGGNRKCESHLDGSGNEIGGGELIRGSAIMRTGIFRYTFPIVFKIEPPWTRKNPSLPRRPR